MLVFITAIEFFLGMIESFLLVKLLKTTYNDPKINIKTITIAIKMAVLFLLTLVFIFGLLTALERLLLLVSIFVFIINKKSK
jgi:hypothetical protein